MFELYCRKIEKNSAKIKIRSYKVIKYYKFYKDNKF